MNALLKICSLAFILTYVNCGPLDVIDAFASDNCEVNEIIKSLEGLNLTQCIAYINTTFTPVMNMSTNRANLAKANNLICYSNMYQNYADYFYRFLDTYVQTLNNDTESNKTASCIQVANVVGTMLWDEKHRLAGGNIPVGTTKLNWMDNLPTLSLTFDGLVTAAVTLLTKLAYNKYNDIGLTFAANFYLNLGNEFDVLYKANKQCCSSLSDGTQKNLCFKVFNGELEAFTRTGTLGKIPCLI